MLVVMRADATAQQIEAVHTALRGYGVRAESLPGHARVAIGVTGNKEYVPAEAVLRLPGVADLIHVTRKYKLVSREFYPQSTVVRVGQVQFGTGRPVVIAGPCSVESEAQVMAAAEAVAAAGAQVLRGGVVKPRTSPYGFQGLGYAGLRYLQAARQATGLPICVEVMRTEDVAVYDQEVDLLQVGARNMQNYDLLRRLGRAQTPVLLKRGLAATVEEWLLAAEYLLDGGNRNVILCERGIRTFETSTRNTLDLNSVALVRQLTHLPVIVDPSHAAGRHDLVPPLARAAIALGCDGLIVEVHPKPSEALSDAAQQLDFPTFECLMQDVRTLSEVLNPLYTTAVDNAKASAAP
jgi:3-deoxy-7-phosphoheptulonate synthase